MTILSPNNLRNRAAQVAAAPAISQARNSGAASAATPSADKKGISMTSVNSYLKYILFLTGVGMVFIWNAHLAERRVKEFDTLKKDVKKLRDEYMMKEAVLSAGTSYYAIGQAADTLGLNKLDHPPFRVVKKQAADTRKLASGE